MQEVQSSIPHQGYIPQVTAEMQWHGVRLPDLWPVVANRQVSLCLTVSTGLSYLPRVGPYLWRYTLLTGCTPLSVCKCWPEIMSNTRFWTYLEFLFTPLLPKFWRIWLEDLIFGWIPKKWIGKSDYNPDKWLGIFILGFDWGSNPQITTCLIWCYGPYSWNSSIINLKYCQKISSWMVVQFNRKIYHYKRLLKLYKLLA